ncbi:hypothetical protein CG747_43300 [Streptomyces sp. CB02959]|nr:hypothetical protein CG747_43300 [Streptomyces sp. CB02959]
MPVLGMLPIAFTLRNFPKYYPYWSDSTGDILAWYSRNRTLSLVQLYTANASLLLELVFFAGLATVVVDTTRRTSMAARLILPAAAVLAADYMVADIFMTIGTLAGTPSHPSTPELVRSALESSYVAVLAAEPAAGMLLIATGLAIRPTRLFPLWTAWSATAIGALNILITFDMLIAAGPLVPLSLLMSIPYIAATLWVGAVGWHLLRVRHELAHRHGSSLRTENTT